MATEHAILDVSLIDRLSDLKKLGLTFDDCVNAFGVDRDTDPVALRAYDNMHREGEIEIDSTTVLSESSGGSYVMAWVWSPDDTEEGEDDE